MLVIAWTVYAVGMWRVAHLSWAGYDPDPSIAQSLSNDSRCAKVLQPFVAVATVIDVIAAGLGVADIVKRRRWWNVLGLILSLLSAGWHGLGFCAACFFAH
jgi:hypothetical protein